MKNASAEGLRRDFLRSCPVFWYGQNNILRGLESHMVILADTSWQGSEPQDIVMVPADEEIYGFDPAVNSNIESRECGSNQISYLVYVV